MPLNRSTRIICALCTILLSSHIVSVDAQRRSRPSSRNQRNNPATTPTITPTPSVETPAPNIAPTTEDSSEASLESVDSAESVESAESAESVESAESAESNESADSAESVESAESAESAETPTQVSVSGTAPADVLGGLTNWKLNGELDDEYVDSIPLEGFSDESQFYTCGNAICFQTYAGKSTSSNSGNPRTELRELTPDGSADIEWPGSGTNVMDWTVSVMELPSSGKVCFGQIHSTEDDFDDVIRVQFEGDEGQVSGDVRMSVKGWVTEDNPEYEGDGFLDGTFTLGEEMDLSLHFTDNVVSLYQNEGGQQVLLFSTPCDSESNYFKAGNYLQSLQDANKDTSDIGIVAISSLEVSHSD